MAVLVDTCVISEVRHSKGRPEVKEAFAILDPLDVFCSVVTIGELTAGIARLEPGARRNDLAAWLGGLEHTFINRILPVDVAVARTWGELTAKCRASGVTLPTSDGLIAATALHHGLSVMTRNERDFAATGVQILNPWTK